MFLLILTILSQLVLDGVTVSKFYELFDCAAYLREALLLSLFLLLIMYLWSLFDELLPFDPWFVSGFLISLAALFHSCFESFIEFVQAGGFFSSFFIFSWMSSICLTMFYRAFLVHGFFSIWATLEIIAFVFLRSLAGTFGIFYSVTTRLRHWMISSLKN